MTKALLKAATEILTAPQIQPAPLWRWRTAHETLMRPEEMETRHLFFTLRMIWNHSMPDDAKLYPYKRYAFVPLTIDGETYYDEIYMQRAIRFIGLELVFRDDIDPRFSAQLDFMKDYLRKHEHALPRELQQLGFIHHD